MTMNSRGEATIAYRELNSYPFPTEGSVKVAFEPKVIFRNGFDCGDTLQWSTTVP